MNHRTEHYSPTPIELIGSQQRLKGVFFELNGKILRWVFETAGKAAPQQGRNSIGPAATPAPFLQLA